MQSTEDRQQRWPVHSAHARILYALLAVSLLIRYLLWHYGASGDHFVELLTTRLPDDAFYYFSTAFQFAQGHGISIDGMHPTNGLHPLWLIIIAPLFAIFDKADAVQAVIALQSILDLVVIWLIADTSMILLPVSEAKNRQSASLIACALYAFSPLVLMHSINGLETTLTSLMLLIWLRTAIGALRTGNAIGFALLGVATGLLLLSRTDMIVVLAPAAVWLLISKRDFKRSLLVVAALPALVIIAPWLWWNYQNFGSILQSSAQAVPFFAMKKYNILYGVSGKYLYLSWDALRNIAKPFLYTTFGISILTIGATTLQRKKWTPGQTFLFLLCAGGVLLLAFHTIARGFIREWYVLEMLPLFYLAFGVSIAMNCGMSRVNLRGRIALAALLLLPGFFRIQHPAYESQTTMLRYALPTEQRLTEHSKVGSLNSGLYSYYCNPEHVVNLDGVVNVRALEYIKRGDLHGYLQADSVDYVLEFRGDLGGYINLIDQKFLSGFVLDTSIATQEASNPIEVYRRVAR